MDYSLNGEWLLTCEETGEKIPCIVPGDITVDHYRAGKIADPYFGMNYKNARFLLERDYLYEKEFSARKADDGERAFLVFDGIDTFADIYLNGVLLGSTENMFLRYKYDVTALIREKNCLRVKIYSTLVRMKAINADSYFACFNKERIFVRKAQCHFGWDWAPDLPGYGIWADVGLVYKPETAIAGVRYTADRFGNVTIYTELNYNVRKDEYAEYRGDVLRYTLQSAPGSEESLVLEFPVGGAKNFRSFRLKEPRLWMPIGYGTPNLYKYSVELMRGGATIDRFDGELGIREVELVQAPVSEDMMGFRLYVNGVDIFVKGSNWVPCECFTGVADVERYETLIKLAADAGMNMLRVWGGGIYEKEIFYQLCDKYGILVWQDFMFACADIPENDPNFVNNVTDECIYQVKRLRNHPSIVYWCGGNEKTGSCGLLKQYGDNLVDITLRGIVEHYDGTRPYVRQSPFSLTDVGNDPESGETHGTAFDIVSLTAYDEFLRRSFERRVTFASECAVMGSCVAKSYRDFVPADELWPMGEIYEDRFCDNPYGALMSFVRRQLKMVDIMFGEANSIDEFAVKSMAGQAEVLKAEVVNTRRKRNVCGGFMNWMFDDIWPTGTWALIDYYLRPKMAYYALKREYAPFRAAIAADGTGKYYGYLFNDTLEDRNVRVVMGGVTLEGVYGKRVQRDIMVPKCSVIELGELDIFGDVLYICCEGQTACAFTKLFKELKFRSDYSVSFGESVQDKNGMYRIKAKVKANAFARMIHFELPDGVTVTDNWFDILPGGETAVEIMSPQPLDSRNIEVSDYVKSVERKNGRV